MRAIIYSSDISKTISLVGTRRSSTIFLVFSSGYYPSGIGGNPMKSYFASSYRLG
jgi:hypothetical protein